MLPAQPPGGSSRDSNVKAEEGKQHCLKLQLDTTQIRPKRQRIVVFVKCLGRILRIDRERESGHAIVLNARG